LTTTRSESRFQSRLTTMASIATVLALVVAVAAWWWPQSPEDGNGASGGRPGTGTTSTAAPTVTSTEPGSPAAEFLAGPGFPAEAGGALLVSVPRAVRDEAAFSSHPVAISCPDNQTGNQASEVTYLLRARYLRFDATVHPYYPPDADIRAASYVFAFVDVRQRDGTLRREERGRQQRAATGAPADLTADVENAEKLIISVQCADPNGVVVLTDARVTATG
jgi:hypothetical protein